MSRSRSAFHLRRALAAGVLVLGIPGFSQSGEIYKSVDADGHVVYSDHLEPSMSQPTPVHLEDSRSLPHELHFCWTNCFTLRLDDGIYRRIDGTDETWTVETFTPESVVLHRHDVPADWNGNSRDVVYAGRIAHDRLVGVTVGGKPVSGVDASWGSALNTLPANDAERDSMTDPSASAADDASSAATVSTESAPPPVPEEEQPPLDEDGLLWIPGYWEWRAPRFFWIGGVWRRPPRSGLLWTPAYWGAAGTVFIFHPGHWGSTVGYYGGVNYGHGYFGSGYSGGHWIGNSFAYNNSINRLDPAVAHHTYAERPSRPSTHPGEAPREAGTLRPSAARPPARVAAHPTPNVPLERDEAQPAPRSVAPAKPAVPAKPHHVPPQRAAPVKD